MKPEMAKASEEIGEIERTAEEDGCRSVCRYGDSQGAAKGNW